jgi:hypothetical protein
MGIGLSSETPHVLHIIGVTCSTGLSRGATRPSSRSCDMQKFCRLVNLTYMFLKIGIFLNVDYAHDACEKQLTQLGH